MARMLSLFTTSLGSPPAPANSHWALEVKQATKSFGASKPALNQVSLRIAKGEMVALLGASGSGKSTLLRSLCGLELLDGKHSSVHMDGQVLQHAGQLARNIRAVRQGTSIIFQQFNLVARLSVLQNVLVGQATTAPLWRTLSGQFNTDSVQRALAALNAVGLQDLAHQRASTLSGGQQQRVAIARALVQGAKVLLADEPVASLDPESSERVMTLLAQLQREQGLTLIVSLHNVALARQYCQRIVVLREGQLVFDGASTDLSDEALRELYRHAPALDELFKP